MNRFYFDVHVPFAIAEQLRAREVDVLIVQDDWSIEAEDPELLLRSTELGRVLFTQDRGFYHLAFEWMATKKYFAGLIYAPQDEDAIGRYVLDLELVAKAMLPGELMNQVYRLPL